MNNEQTVSLSDTIYRRVTDSLRIAIVTGEFKPGQQLKMSELISMFGTSQMPIREALQQLQGEGLVRIIPHRGGKVDTLISTIKAIICDLRMSIEALLVRKACEKEDRSWIKELIETQNIYDDLSKDKDSVDIIEANRRFHKIHNEIASNREAIDMLQRTNTLLTVIRTTYGYPRDRIIQVGIEHHQLIECFNNKDVKGVLEVHRDHCERARVAFLKEMPE